MGEGSEGKLSLLLSAYKIPLILAGIGVLFLIIAFTLLFRLQNASSEVIFSAAESSPSGKTSTKIRIDVEGAVMGPGVYVLADGDRITQALAVAGGLSGGADRDWISKNLNLAAKLVDGGKIYIPSVAEATSGKSENDSSSLSSLSNPSNLLGVTTGKVNVNTATQSELEALPGIGPVTAGKIIAARPYQIIEELKAKKAVGNALYEKIKDLIVVY